jgi:hypothetical protein
LSTVHQIKQATPSLLDGEALQELIRHQQYIAMEVESLDDHMLHLTKDYATKHFADKPFEYITAMDEFMHNVTEKTQIMMDNLSFQISADIYDWTSYYLPRVDGDDDELQLQQQVQNCVRTTQEEIFEIIDSDNTIAHIHGMANSLVSAEIAIDCQSPDDSVQKARVALEDKKPYKLIVSSLINAFRMVEYMIHQHYATLMSIPGLVCSLFLFCSYSLHPVLYFTLDQFSNFRITTVTGDTPATRQMGQTTINKSFLEHLLGESKSVSHNTKQEQHALEQDFLPRLYNVDDTKASVIRGHEWLKINDSHYLLLQIPLAYELLFPGDLIPTKDGDKRQIFMYPKDSRLVFSLDKVGAVVYTAIQQMQKLKDKLNFDFALFHFRKDKTKTEEETLLPSGSLTRIGQQVTYLSYQSLAQYANKTDPFNKKSDEYGKQASKYSKQKQTVDMLRHDVNFRTVSVAEEPARPAAAAEAETANVYMALLLQRKAFDYRDLKPEMRHVIRFLQSMYVHYIVCLRRIIVLFRTGQKTLRDSTRVREFQKIALKADTTVPVAAPAKTEMKEKMKYLGQCGGYFSTALKKPINTAILAAITTFSDAVAEESRAPV